MSDYRLVPFGVVFHNSKGSRQFFPVAYGFGEGEREVVVLITLLSVKLAVKKLFGIDDVTFKGGICSDHSSAFVNAFIHSFPETTPVQCYSHVIRKFINPIRRSTTE